MSGMSSARRRLGASIASARRRFVAALAVRAEQLEAAFGLALMGVGAALVYLPAGLILVGGVIFAFAVWGRRLT